jgi:hypothetical protein
MPRPTGQQKTNFLTYFMANGCGSSLYVYIETATDALFESLLYVLGTSMVDVVRAVARPGKLGMGPHLKRGRKYPKPVIPETSDIIAYRIPITELAKDREVTAGVQTLWRIDNIGQEVGYYLMIAEVIDDFYWNWYSGIIKHTDRDCPGISRCIRNGDTGLPVGSGFFGAALPDLKQEQNIFSDPHGASIPPGVYNIIFSCNAENNDPRRLPVEVQIRFRVDTDEGPKYFYSERIILNWMVRGGLIAQATVRAAGGVIWEVGKFPIAGAGAEAYFHDCEIFIMQVDHA